MKTVPTSSCAIIIPSCDAYSDVWPSFFTTFFKYWPDCPYPIYLIANTQTYPDARVHPVLINPDRGWTDNMTEALGRC